MFRSIAISVCLLLLAGCARDEGSALREPMTRNGTVVVAFGANPALSRYKGYTLYLRRVSRIWGTGIPLIVRGMAADTPDFHTGGETGIVWAAQLPAGEYEIYDLSGEDGGYFWERETRLAEPLAIRFLVLPGTTTYLGHYLVDAAADNAAALKLTVTDESANDIARARARYPELEQVQVAVPHAALAVNRASALATP